MRHLAADICTQLDYTGATLKNPESEEKPEGYAFVGDELSVKGDMFLNDVKATGEVRLVGAEIGGQFECNGARFENPSSKENTAFMADGLFVKGNMVLNGVTVNGLLRLPGAHIGGQLDCTGAVFKNPRSEENPEGDAFIAQDLKVNEELFLTMKTISGILNLRYAKVGGLVDEETSWPAQDNLILEGFEYGAFTGSSTPKTADERLKWLRLQLPSHLSLQSYEQLAKVLRDSGRESDSRTVLKEEQNDLRRHGKLNGPATVWNWFLWITIGHGYDSLKGIYRFIIPLLLLGWLIFYRADKWGVMLPSKDNICQDENYLANKKLPLGYPRFCPIIYSIEVFIPFLKLHQEDCWLPAADNLCGRCVLVYFWVHIVFGWVFSTLAVVSLTSLVR